MADFALLIGVFIIGIIPASALAFHITLVSLPGSIITRFGHFSATALYDSLSVIYSASVADEVAYRTPQLMKGIIATAIVSMVVDAGLVAAAIAASNSNHTPAWVLLMSMWSMASLAGMLIPSVLWRPVYESIRSATTSVDTSHCRSAMDLLNITIESVYTPGVTIKSNGDDTIVIKNYVTIFGPSYNATGALQWNRENGISFEQAVLPVEDYGEAVCNEMSYLSGKYRLYPNTFVALTSILLFYSLVLSLVLLHRTNLSLPSFTFPSFSFARHRRNTWQEQVHDAIGNSNELQERPMSGDEAEAAAAPPPPYTPGSKPIVPRTKEPLYNKNRSTNVGTAI